MFTGIIQNLGQVLELARSPESPGSELKLCVQTRFSDLTLGESVAINGVCLTVTELLPQGRLYFYVSRETLERTNLGSLEPGTKVNLERALLASDRLSGHVVQGHVDGLARFLGATPIGEGHEARFELNSELARYCVKKGSIALNGVSLTLNEVRGTQIAIMLIPLTWQHTNLSLLRPGDAVNVETDIFAKYIAKYLDRPKEDQL